jgi:hypothetical protein
VGSISLMGKRDFKMKSERPTKDFVIREGTNVLGRWEGEGFENLEIRILTFEVGLAVAFADLPALPTGRQAAGRRGRLGWFLG